MVDWSVKTVILNAAKDLITLERGSFGGNKVLRYAQDDKMVRDTYFSSLALYWRASATSCAVGYSLMMRS